MQGSKVDKLLLRLRDYKIYHTKVFTTLMIKLKKE